MGTKQQPAEELKAKLRRLKDGVGRSRDAAALLHELQVYQEELGVQNEVLRGAQSELEEARDRFVELYDFAPNGYLTLDAHGRILRINRTGAAWLGRSKTALEGLPIFAFIVHPHRERMMDFIRRCHAHEETTPLTTDVTLRTSDGTREVQLLCRSHGKGDAVREIFTAMVDISEYRRLEGEREDALHQRAALAGRILSIQEKERRRIARDLHDDVGQLLTALRLKLDAIELAMPDQAAIGQRLAEAQVLGERLDRTLDFIASELRPASLDLGLATALEQFALDWSRNFGMPVRMRLDGAGSLRLPPETETHLYRVAQEALHNVYKHSRARTVDIVLERRGSQFVLTVEDDGIGLDPARPEVKVRRGFGLVGMRERVHLMGGSLEFERRPSGGTRVVVAVPLR